MNRLLLLLSAIALSNPAIAEPGDPPSKLIASLEQALLEARPDAMASPHYASLPLVAAAVLTEDQQITASDAADSDYFGHAIAIEGRRAVIGAWGEDLNGVINAGAAYVFAFDGTAWVEETKLTAHDAAQDDEFGRAVALSGDRVIVGAPLNDFTYVSGPNAGTTVVNGGAVYLFAFDGTSWVQERTIIPPGTEFDDRVGTSVALSGDRALVGTPGRDLYGVHNAGSVYTLHHDGTDWTLDGSIVPFAPYAPGAFGASVSLEADRALVGAPQRAHSGMAEAGVAYVFTHDGTGWTQQAVLTPADAAVGAWFSYSVALDSDRALIGAPLDDHGGEQDAGAAYVFSFAGSTWAETAKLVPSTVTESARVGHAVALDGDQALAGAFDVACSAGPDCGTAYVFTLDGAAWTETAMLTASDAAAYDHLGFTVALSENRALLGANLADPGGIPDAGAVYAFTLGGNPTPAERLGMLADDIQALIDEGTLDNGQGQGLKNALRQARRALDRNDTDQAIHFLTQFIHRVEELARPRGRHPAPLTQSQAAALITDAQALIDALPGSPRQAAVRAAPSGAGLSAYPNPFNPSTVLSFETTQDGPAYLAVFDLLGREVAVLMRGPAEAGRHEVRFDARALPTGTYLVRLATHAGVQTRRITLLR